MIECKACLVAALVAIVVLTLAAALGIWIAPAVGAQTVRMDGCSQKTCATIPKETQEALGVSGAFTLAVDSVVAVGAIPGCANCAKVVTSEPKSGVTFFVMGAPADVACRIFGGDYCQEKPK